MAGMIEQLIEAEQRRSLAGYALGGAAPDTVAELERAMGVAERAQLVEEQLWELDMQGASPSEMASAVLGSFKGSKYDKRQMAVVLKDGTKVVFSKFMSKGGNGESKMTLMKSGKKMAAYKVTSPRAAVKKLRGLTERVVRVPPGFEPTNKIQKALLSLLRRGAKAEGPKKWFRLEQLARAADLRGVPYEHLLYAAFALGDYGMVSFKEFGAGKGTAVRLRKKPMGESLEEKRGPGSLDVSGLVDFLNKKVHGVKLAKVTGRNKFLLKSSWGDSWAVEVLDGGKSIRFGKEQRSIRGPAGRTLKNAAATVYSFLRDKTADDDWFEEDRDAYWSQGVEAIVEALQGAEGVTLSAPDIAEATGLDKAAVRHELALMGQAGMVARTRPAGDVWRLTHFGEACGKPHGKTPRMETYEALSEARKKKLSREQQLKDQESLRDDGVIWRTTKSGHEIGISPDGRVVKGNPHHPAVPGKASSKAGQDLQKRAKGMMSTKGGISRQAARDQMYSLGARSLASDVKKFVGKAGAGAAAHLKAMQGAIQKLAREEAAAASGEGGGGLLKAQAAVAKHAQQAMRTAEVEGQRAAKEKGQRAAAERKAERKALKKTARAEIEAGAKAAAERERTAAFGRQAAVREKHLQKRAAAAQAGEKTASGAQEAVKKVASKVKTLASLSPSQVARTAMGGEGEHELSGHLEKMLQHAQTLGNDKVAGELRALAKKTQKLDDAVADRAYSMGDDDDPDDMPEFQAHAKQAKKLHSLAQKLGGK